MARPLLPALKDAGLAGFVALVLALPLVGFQTVDSGGALIVQTRFDSVAAGVAAVVVARLIFALWPANWRLRQRREPVHVDQLQAGAGGRGRGGGRRRRVDDLRHCAPPVAVAASSRAAATFSAMGTTRPTFSTSKICRTIG